MLSCVRQHSPSPCTDYLTDLARTKNIRYFCLPCSCALFYRSRNRGGRLGVGHSRPVLHATRIFLTCPARPAPTHSANTTLIPEIRTFSHVKNNLYRFFFFEKTCCLFGIQNPDSFARWPPHPSLSFYQLGGWNFEPPELANRLWVCRFKLLLTSFT